MSTTAWHTDKRLAARACNFFEQHLRHVKGEWAGEPFELAPWQRKLLADLLGQVDGQGVRRYRRSLIAIPRKNGKSTLAAGLALYLLLADNEPGAEVYSCAADRNQASIVFDIAKNMVLADPHLASVCKVLRHRIIVEGTGSFYQSMAAEAYTAHGVNAHAVIFDELHTQKTPDFWEAMVTSQGARRQPLFVQITTAGWNRNSVCWTEWDYAAKVRDGILENERYLPAIYAAPKDADWTSPDVWRAANPSLGESVKLDHLMAACEEAANNARKENTFRQLHLNQWTEQAVRWIPMDAWDHCGDADVDEAELAGRECYAGLDLSSTRDICALALLFPGPRARLVMRYWVPGESAREREEIDRVPYTAWERLPSLTMTGGNRADYDAIRAEISTLAARFKIVQLGVDKWNAQQLTTQLMGDGMDVVGFGQGMSSMSAPSKEFERLILDRRLAHGRCPVLRWMASNASVRSDDRDNIRPTKGSAIQRIDGIIAAILATALASSALQAPSAYKSRGVRVL